MRYAAAMFLILPAVPAAAHATHHPHVHGEQAWLALALPLVVAAAIAAWRASR